MAGDAEAVVQRVGEQAGAGGGADLRLVNPIQVLPVEGKKNSRHFRNGKTTCGKLAAKIYFIAVLLHIHVIFLL